MPEPTTTGAKIMAGVQFAEQLLGSQFASFMFSMALKKFAGELTDADRESLEQNYGEGLEARADAFERANRS